MSIRIGLSHVTRYTYDRKIALGPQTIRLRPAPHTRTPIVSYGLEITPKDHFINWQQDPFGNYEARLVFPEHTDVFEVKVDVVADMVAINPFDFFLDDDAYHAPFAYTPDLKADLAPYLVCETEGAEFEALAEKVSERFHNAEPESLRSIDFLVELNQQVQSLIGYIVRLEPGVQEPEETLIKAKGSCRDSAWLLVNLLRRAGIAARFVSGYLVQLTADEKPVEGPEGPEADFTDLHAWAEAFIPGAGWIGLDATSGLFAGEGHIPLAATPAPQSAAPINGAHEPCDEVRFDFDMQLKRLREPARITKPMTDAQFAELDAAGEAVEAKLVAGEVRLTMGGEPTFVAQTDRDADEWTTDAVGPTKRAFGDKFLRKLQKRFGKGGLLTHGQGKWYPGEPLPRWAFAVTWRKDGEPLWRNPDLIAEEETTNTVDLAGFAEALTDELEIDASFAQPMYEDPARYLYEEAKLPLNLTPETNELDNPIDRARLAKVFSQGLGKPMAMVLPLQQAQRKSGGRAVQWMSEIWETRRGKLFAIPGDSPAGFRLPMKELPHLEGTRYPEVYPQDPFGLEAKPLPRVQIVGQQPRNDAEKPVKKRPTRKGPVRTALAIEERDGICHIFLPPVQSGEAYVDLIAAVEAAAERLEMPVRIEGYPAPNDPRLAEIKVTPDPGVLEINIHPASSWGEVREITKGLYEDARACGLDAAGFQLDGRPQGSGGGNHVVVGGSHPEDSPFLRHPDVLGSLIRIWQRHPSLSYLFSGQFIGPTSQAPRLDEARMDMIHEVELALKQIPLPNQDAIPPWMVDRVLRNLLVDVTGNTHRAEICIDKLYSPDGPTGRLGLVEFRGFEMPPHWQMSLAQQLLVRALIVWVWGRPYTEPLKDHGLGLHDKYMLPDVLWQDFRYLLDQVSQGIGVKLDPEWYRAQFDFRFPELGRFTTDDLTVELRSALEPWHVLGEEGMATGMTRFVDSSLNRLQLRLTGDYNPERVTLLCNHRPVPLQQIGGALVGGIRFRTWEPVSALHPTIPATPKLTFDLYSKANGRAIAGASYWATHPGGRNFETRPINALEAESRIRGRFFAGDHTVGEIIPQEPHQNPKTPWTLDLRQ